MASYSVTFQPQNLQLRKYVKYIWAMIGEEPTGSAMLLPPVTDFDLVFSFGAGTHWNVGNRNYSLDQTFTCGARTKPVYIQAKGVVHYLSVTFYPTAIFPFLGLPLNDLRGEPVELDLLPCPTLHHATEQLWEQHELKQKTHFVESLLLNRLAQCKETENPLLNGAVDWIQKSEGRLSVNEVCNKMGVSSRKLERDFAKWIGFTPKQFIKVERFNHVFRTIAEPNFNQDWFELVLRYGYHDQSHLIHDFKSMMEQTPEEFLFNLRNHPELFAS